MFNPLAILFVILLAAGLLMLDTLQRTDEEQLASTHSLLPFYTPNQCRLAFNVVGP